MRKLYALVMPFGETRIGFVDVRHLRHVVTDTDDALQRSALRASFLKHALQHALAKRELAHRVARHLV